VRGATGAGLALVVALLTIAQPALGGDGMLVGFDDDQITWTEHPGRVLGEANALGVDAMRVTLRWHPGRRNLVARDHTVLRRAVVAHTQGVRVVLSVYGRATDAPATWRSRDAYCRFVRNALRRYSEITDVVIWNEANSPAFWRPRVDRAASYEALLAQCWDLLHSTIPGVSVLTSTAGGHEPIEFVRGIGFAYAASGRTRPIFDTFGHNPYPFYPGEPPAATHDTYVGEGDYERLVAAIDESFAGTGQPPTQIWYLENGFQTTVGRRYRRRYAGRETQSQTLTPAGQARQLAAALRLAYCQPRVGAFFNFLLVDEPTLPGWQSGLLWVDWERKPAFAAYREAIDDVHRGAVVCGPETGWPAPAGGAGS
jgi:hypothetical protein